MGELTVEYLLLPKVDMQAMMLQMMMMTHHRQPAIKSQYLQHC